MSEIYNTEPKIKLECTISAQVGHVYVQEVSKFRSLRVYRIEHHTCARSSFPRVSIIAHLELSNLVYILDSWESKVVSKLCTKPYFAVWLFTTHVFTSREMRKVAI